MITKILNERSFNKEDGFTLLELLVCVAIVGVLAAIAIPVFSNYKEKARVSKVAMDLKGFGIAFNAYAIENDTFPNDSNLILPPGANMHNYLREDVWLETTGVGGNYNWEGPNFYPYAGISITGATASAETMATLDRMLDNGDLNTGVFRITPNGRYTYILDE